MRPILEINTRLETQVLGFDVRIVPYEEIHSIRKQDFERLVQVVDPQQGDYIVDAGCGYGAVTREILRRHGDKNMHFYLFDISQIQLERAVDQLCEEFGDGYVEERIEFVHDALPSLTLLTDGFTNWFDKVIAKMVIHEIPREKQLLALKELHRLLKPGGKIVIWDLMLDAFSQKFFQQVIRRKDEIAGYRLLAANRYFLREDEWLEMLSQAGFVSIRRESDVLYELHTAKRLEHEFGGDLTKLTEWHEYIRQKAQEAEPTALEKLSFRDHGDDIILEPPKAIYSAVKA